MEKSFNLGTWWQICSLSKRTNIHQTHEKNICHGFCSPGNSIKLHLFRSTKFPSIAWKIWSYLFRSRLAWSLSKSEYCWSATSRNSKAWPLIFCSVSLWRSTKCSWTSFSSCVLYKTTLFSSNCLMVSLKSSWSFSFSAVFKSNKL